MTDDRTTGSRPAGPRSTDDLHRFGPDFLWGVSTSAYQIEGAVDEGGRGRSSWDTFSARPGRTHQGDTGAVACDHYHRYADDVALMGDLGVTAYRFSFAWPRIQPDGTGSANPAGLDFYDRLIDELLAQGIEPAPTLFHWDTPQPLEDRGGWLNRDITDRFADYAAILGERFADRVGMWMTVNEPVVLTLHGYASPVHAPGLDLGLRALPVAHHQLLAHGRAVQALRAAGAARVGIASNHQPVLPASDTPADRAAAAAYDDLYNWAFGDPVLLGRYPSDEIAAAMPGPLADDLTVISTPLDWYGVNYYAPIMIAAAEPSADGSRLPYQQRRIEGHPTTDFGWPVVPESFRDVLVSLRARYGEALPPIYITENGCAINDAPDATGTVRDDRRIDYLDQHLRALRTAIDAGVDVRGYFQWSLLDNFEWAAGYSQRFGIVYVDFATQRRTPKASFTWYAGVIRANR